MPKVRPKWYHIVRAFNAIDGIDLYIEEEYMVKDKIIKKIKLASVTLMTAAFFLTGCGSTLGGDEPEVSVDVYDKIVYSTTPVMKGDITPEVKVFLYAEDEKKVNYYPYVDSVTLEKIYVNEGDYVRKGDVLATFDCESIDSAIKSYENEIEEDLLLIEHYKKLHEIDETVSYDEEIKLLNDRMSIAKLYVEELQAKKDDYNIVAEREGVVLKVSDITDTKNISRDTLIMTVIYGSGMYTADMEKYDFKVDEEFTVSSGGADFTMKVIDVNESEKTAYFKLQEEVVLGQATIGMNIEKPTIKDVIYIPFRSVFEREGKSYVYMLDENGYRYAREIELGDQIDDWVIVKSGLSEGEEVVK